MKSEYGLELIEGTIGAIELQLDGKHLRNCVLNGTTLVYNGGDYLMENVISSDFKLGTYSRTPAYDRLAADMQRRFTVEQIPPPQRAFMKVGPNSALSEPFVVDFNGGGVNGFDVFLDTARPVDVKISGTKIRGPTDERGDDET